MRNATHHQHDIAITADDLGYARLSFGPDLSPDDIPIDGEIIRFGGRLYSVGIMDDSDPPVLTEADEISVCGLWWDADDPAECEATA